MYDAIVIGGGPAGAACAIWLGRAGARVLLLDHAAFPRDKACGDAWGFRKAVPLLAELGVLDALPRDAVKPIRALVIGSPAGGLLRLPIPQHHPAFATHAIVCPRRIVDSLIWQEAGRVAEARDRMTVTQLLYNDGRVVGVVAQDGRDRTSHRFMGRVVVGADGAGSRIRQLLGQPMPRGRESAVGMRAYYRGVRGLSDDVELYFLPRALPGYAWVFPFGDGMANVGVVAPADRMPGGGAMEDRLLAGVAAHPVLRTRLADAQRIGPVSGWPLPAHRRVPQLAWDGAVLIGDAAGLIDPWLWEGLGNALASAKVAAQVVATAIRSDDCSARFLAAYTREVRRTIGRELARGAALQRLASWPGVLNHLVRCATAWPRLAERLAANMAAPDAHANVYRWPL